MSFYYTFIKLCNEKGKSPSRVAEDIGLSRTSPNGWKKGKFPSDANLQKIADYFGVTTNYLLGKEERDTELINNDTELTSYLEELKNRPEMRMLFSITKSCTKEEVEQAVRIIEALRNEN